MAKYIVSKKINKIIICKTFYLFNAYINLDIFKLFLFADIDIVHSKIFLFCKSFIQVVIRVIMISTIFNRNPRLNTSSFSYIIK